VSHVKPKASRAESPEVYVLATGFRGAGLAKPQAVGT
jgi:23S rRNA U2552 (ribose-2'-O)-methylase RlmE/FtsJ